MIGLDTNVIVRLLTNDEPEHVAVAQRYLQNRCSDSNPAWIGIIATIETVWVLQSRYRFDRATIADAFERILRAAHVVFEAEEHVTAALAEYRDGADFSDALMSRLNRAEGCTTTITFDRRAASQLDGLTLLAADGVP
ncbi:MAG: type II toxin-antitoxin system VapC family toxin [bacterium]|nr:type II toxin-antitoxin system VapC family toxin [bacterium]